MDGAELTPGLLHACTPGLWYAGGRWAAQVSVDRDGPVRYADSALGATTLTDCHGSLSRTRKPPPVPCRRPCRARSCGSLRNRVRPRAGQLLVMLEAMKMEHSSARPATARWRRSAYRPDSRRPGRHARGHRTRMAPVSDAVHYEVDDGVAWLTIDRPEPATPSARRCAPACSPASAASTPTATPRCLCSPAPATRRSAPAATSRRWPTPGCGCPRRTSCPSSAATSRSPSRPSRRSTASPTPADSCWPRCATCAWRPPRPAFAITEAKVGRGAPWAAPLPWLIPPRVAMEILLTGDLIDAAPGRADGPGQPGRARARTCTTRSGTGPAHRRQRAAVGAGGQEPCGWSPSTRSPPPRRGRRIWEPVYPSEDAQEGPAAFRDKRPPVWKGR